MKQEEEKHRLTITTTKDRYKRLKNDRERERGGCSKLPNNKKKFCGCYIIIYTNNRKNVTALLCAIKTFPKLVAVILKDLF